jgi:YHS domain-containing protein
MRSQIIVLLMAIAAIVGTRSIVAEDKGGSTEPKLVCPVSGKTATKDHAQKFEGVDIYFCCDNCPKAFAKDTSKYAAKARCQACLTGQMQQVHCPITHKPMKAETAVSVDGVKVAFCCNNCKAKVEKMAANEQVSECFGHADCFKAAAK